VPRPVKTVVHNDARVHESWTQASFWTPVSTGREHGRGTGYSEPSLKVMDVFNCLHMHMCACVCVCVCVCVAVCVQMTAQTVIELKQMQMRRNY